MTDSPEHSEGPPGPRERTPGPDRTRGPRDRSYRVSFAALALLIGTVLVVPAGALSIRYASRAADSEAEQEKPPVPRERGPHDATARHPFNEVKKWVRVFDDPSRATWQMPEKVAAAMSLKPGMTVADLGAGTGYFVEYLSKPVSPGGMILAIDTEPEMVKYIGARVGRDGLDNVVPVLAHPGDPFLPRGRVDRVLIVDTYHHIDDRLRYFGRMKEALVPGGRVVVVDFKKKPLPVGPPVEHKLSRDFVVEEMQKSGWILDREETFLQHQYFLIFRPSDAR
jgi:SAM-dependent methyltransferase